MSSLQKKSKATAAINLLKHPSLIFKPSRGIFLFSHMRARTSVISHVLGSHTEIAGHGELHLSYNSNIDLLKARILINNRNKPIFLHDKILHNYLVFSDEILKKTDHFFLFTIRNPKDSLRSFIRLYLKNHSQKEAMTDKEIQQHFKEYYIKRLKTLNTLAEKIGSKGIYFESDLLLSQTSQILSQISSSLGLSSPLVKEYHLFNETGTRGHGDNVGGLFEGSIKNIQHKDSITIDAKICNDMQPHYEDSHTKLSSILTSIPS